MIQHKDQCIWAAFLKKAQRPSTFIRVFFMRIRKWWQSNSFYYTLYWSSLTNKISVMPMKLFVLMVLQLTNHNSAVSDMNWLSRIEMEFIVRGNSFFKINSSGINGSKLWNFSRVKVSRVYIQWQERSVLEDFQLYMKAYKSQPDVNMQ